MTYLIITLLAVLVVSISLALSKKGISLSNILKVLGITLFFVYIVRLFSRDAIDSVFNLLLIDIDTPINSSDTWIMGVFMSIFIVILRWLTISSIVFLIVNPFFKLKNVRIISSFFVLIVGLLNLIFFNQNLIMMIGEIDYSSYRSIEFMIETSLLIGISTVNIYAYIKEFGLPKFKDLTHSLGIVFISGLAVMPLRTLTNLVGYYGEIPEDYNTSHLLMLLLLPTVFLIVSYLVMKKKKQPQKDFFLAFLAIAAIIQYFSYGRVGLGGLPLHLCNMGVLLILISITFRFRGIFYFNYFANVLGALMALLFPSITSDLFSADALRYLYNHWFIFVWPVLGVALGTFERPVLKDMFKAIIVFTVYFIAMVFVNAWFNNYQSVDYFFTYSNHISDMLGITNIQYDYIVEFEYKGLTFTFFWLFQILYYFGFIFLMFASWYVYDAFFSYFEQRRKLISKQKQMKLENDRFLELLDGKDPSSPINPGGTDMIKIKNFSKQYGHSKIFAVKDFSLEVKKGEVFGFLGHNGAGKSTTIKSLVGIQAITEGEMEICGYSIKSQPLEAKLQIGYVSDNHALYEKLTGREYVQYVCDLYKVSDELREERLDGLLERFNLTHAIDTEIKSYSHGMKQKLVVVAALIHEPPVWILDEPLTGLDPTSSYQIKESMKDHAAKGNIVFFSSHVIEVVEKICDRIAIITNGHLQGVYDMKEIREKNISLEELYMSSINVIERAVEND